MIIFSGILARLIFMAEKIGRPGRTLSVFDFDGTLTRHDSFIPFLRFAFGRWVFTKGMLKLAVPTLACATRQLTRDELKELLIKTFLTNVEQQWLEKQAQAYCDQVFKKLMRPKGLLAIAAEINSGATVTICSASPEIVLQPFAARLGIKLIGTQLAVKDGKLTGAITGHNCRSAQKVARLEAVYGPLEQFHLRAWGDTRGDYELLASAQDPHWRYFHKPRAQRGSPIGKFK